MTSLIAGVLSGGLSVATDIVSSTVLGQVLQITTQRDLLVLIAAALLAVLLFAEQMLTVVFAKTDVLPPVLERVILRYVTLPKLALAFVLLRLLMLIATDLFDTSSLRWNDAIVVVCLVFSALFLVVERSRPPEKPKDTDAPATTGGN